MKHEKLSFGFIFSHILRRLKSLANLKSTSTKVCRNARFKVVTLDGVSNSLQPEKNFRAELLAARTANRRITKESKSIFELSFQIRFKTSYAKMGIS